MFELRDVEGRCAAGASQLTRAIADTLMDVQGRVEAVGIRLLLARLRDDATGQVILRRAGRVIHSPVVEIIRHTMRDVVGSPGLVL